MTLTYSQIKDITIGALEILQDEIRIGRLMLFAVQQRLIQIAVGLGIAVGECTVHQAIENEPDIGIGHVQLHGIVSAVVLVIDNLI
jgi:hypothetical protein